MAPSKLQLMNSASSKVLLVFIYFWLTRAKSLENSILLEESAGVLKVLYFLVAKIISHFDKTLEIAFTLSNNNSNSNAKESTAELISSVFEQLDSKKNLFLQAEEVLNYANYKVFIEPFIKTVLKIENTENIKKVFDYAITQLSSLLLSTIFIGTVG